MILSAECTDKLGRAKFEIRLLHSFGFRDARLTLEKIEELWELASQHDSLFSDYTQGSQGAFNAVLLDPGSIWFEIAREDEIVGAAYVTRVIPGCSLSGHIAFWDRIAKGREPIVWVLADYLMTEFDLMRIDAQIPDYQHGTAKFLKRCGFKEEGRRREAIQYHNRRRDMIHFGLLRSDFHGRYTFWQRAERDSTGDSGSGRSSGEETRDSDQLRRA